MKHRTHNWVNSVISWDTEQHLAGTDSISIAVAQPHDTAKLSLCSCCADQTTWRSCSGRGRCVTLIGRVAVSHQLVTDVAWP